MTPLITVSESPFNAETPLSELSREITPAELFYVRCNFDVPVLAADGWRLELGGVVRKPLVLTLDQLKQLPRRTVAATIECAGNGRKLMRPVPAGTAWGLGAVSAGTFSGVALRDVLELCDVGDDAVEILFEGADHGLVDGREVRFARSLPLERALHPDTLLAWSLNEAPLAPEHGYPLRLLVPDWYGVASVKWLTRIIALREPFDGHFQTERYVYAGDPQEPDGTPVTRMRVRSLITEPAHGAVVRGPVRLRGIAWSGFGAVRRVDVSTDGGTTWTPAVLTPGSTPYLASRWELEWVPEHGGEHELIARAEDATGAVQPLQPLHNALGYGNNVVHRVRVTVRAG